MIRVPVPGNLRGDAKKMRCRRVGWFYCRGKNRYKPWIEGNGAYHDVGNLVVYMEDFEAAFQRGEIYKGDLRESSAAG